MSACAKNAFGHWAKRTQPACLRGEKGSQLMFGAAPPISDVVSSHSQEPLLENLKPVAPLSRQPLLGQVTIFGAPTNRTPRRRSRSGGGLEGADWTWPTFPLDHFSPLELSQGNVGCQANLPLLSPNHIAHD